MEPGSLPQTQVPRLFTLLDTNGDGVISQKEFLQAMEPERNTRVLTPQRPPGPAPRRAWGWGQTPQEPVTSKAEPCERSTLPDPVMISPKTELHAAGSERWGSETASPDSSPRLRSEASPRGAEADMPPVMLRLMEAIVAEEVAGLGECLSLCSSKSRTLKLLGFQHLHFDARLQGFLEGRACTVLRPVADALLLVRGLLGFREAARHSFLWRRLVGHQNERRANAARLAKLASTHRSARKQVAEQVARLLSHQTEGFQRFGLSEWSRAVSDARLQRLSERLEELSAQHQLQHAEKEALREKHVRERLQKYSSLLGQILGQSFAAWKAEVDDGRERQRRQQRLAKSFCSAASAILETVVQAWVQATQDNRVTRKRQELLREQKLREVDRILRTGIGQGAELYCILQAWHSAVERRQGAFQQRSKAVEAVAQLAVDHLRLAFSGWVSCCKAQRAAQAQRLQSVQKTVAVGLQAGLASIWAAWRQCMDTKRRKQKVEQHMSGLMRSQQEKGLGHFLLLWNMGAVKRKFLKLQAVVLSHRRGRDRALAAIRWLEGRNKQQLAGLFFPWLRQVAGWREKRQAKARYLSLVDCCNLQQQGFWLHAWRGAVREMHHERCRAEMENLKAEHQEQLQRQKEEQIGSRREALKKHFAGSMENLRANSFAAWRDFLIACREEQRLRDAAKQRGELAAQRAAVGLLQSLQAGCFGAWADFQKRQKAESRQNLATSLVQRQLNSSRENFLSLAFGGWLQILKQRGQTARHDAVARRAFARCARASLSQCFAEWRETVRRERLQHLTTELARAKSALRMFENELEQAKERRRCELAGRFMSTSSSMQQQFFQVWKKLVEENIRKAARSAVALRMACKGDQALKVEVFSAWVRQAARERAEQARQRSRQQVLRQLGLSSAGSLSAAVGAWKSFLQARRGAKERLKRGHAIAARRIAELEEPLLALGFAGFRGVVAAARVQQAADARCSHFRSRVVRCDRSFAEKAAAMHDCACLSRSLLLWRLLASVRCAVSFERRKLARASGLGKATAVRLRHRIHQLRVMWAWLMSSKLKPWERPFLVKPLKEAPLALPMGSPRARSPQVQVFTSRVEPLEAEMDQESAAAAAAAAWVREASRSPSPTRFRVTTSPTRLQQGERYTLASKAATSEGDYRQLLEHNRRQIREQRGAARCSSPEPAGQWGLWAK